MEILRDRNQRKLFLSQKSYIQKLLSRFVPVPSHACNPIDTTVSGPLPSADVVVDNVPLLSTVSTCPELNPVSEGNPPVPGNVAPVVVHNTSTDGSVQMVSQSSQVILEVGLVPLVTGPMSSASNELVLSTTGGTTVNTAHGDTILQQVKEVLAHPGWTAAVNVEMAALRKNTKWVLVLNDSTVNSVGSWVYKTKLKSDGTMDRLKARLVAKGYSQIEGMDYLDTISLVIKPATILLGTLM
ncbi:hypothetical protein NE237_004493 [Protea cynaroides]|uniref:Reverse transcriptase Ty1/copia-type domain-containing protein n=1 Tax=Protea cynaroides TaxID=273540 RepID=A0A9Q0KJJ0_9MAGN|nr:hypothetical protein NE237_004493 [Protea cynaroides]